MLKRAINNKLISIKSKHYPCCYYPVKPYRFIATIGIGGNVSNVLRRFNHLVFKFRRDKAVQVLKTGFILKNPPFGYTQQEDFYNSVILVGTSMQPKELLAYLMRVEKYFSRKRTFKNAPRTLDLDILFFDNRVVHTPKLIIPHPHWQERDSVVIPLLSLSA